VDRKSLESFWPIIPPLFVDFSLTRVNALAGRPDASAPPASPDVALRAFGHAASKVASIGEKSSQNAFQLFPVNTP